MPLDAKDIFEATSQSARRLLSDQGLGFYIPPYQRPYSWDAEKVERLIEDVVHGFCKLITKEDSFTFIGTIIIIHDTDFKTIQPIVKQDVPGKVLNVIDGQQRLTTLLLFCVALHDAIFHAHQRMLRSMDDGAMSANTNHPVGWLNGQSLQVLTALKETFVQIQSFGSARMYPRMIRSFDDQWSKDIVNAKYNSPISHLISAYCAAAFTDGQVPPEFKPIVREHKPEGEEALIGRYKLIAKILKNVVNQKADELLEEFPRLEAILNSTILQRSLLNHEFPEEVTLLLRSAAENPQYVGLLRLVLLASYVLDRVAVTAVRGKNEDYAFSVFESLNTTGEPLTAFETFKPRVVRAEQLDRYEISTSRTYIDEVSNYLAAYKAGKETQDATTELLVHFASAETGAKLSKRLSDQRVYLKDEYARYEENQVERISFVKHLRDTATFLQYAWLIKGQPNLHGLPIDATTDATKLCVAFLRDAGHSITIGALVRFYSTALATDQKNRQSAISDFESAIKAITAFTILWRVSRRGTAGIDHVFRDLMNGYNMLTSMPPLARKLRDGSSADAIQPSVDSTAIKLELKAKLANSNYGGIASKADWITQSALIPAYTNSRQVARFALLAAYHDAVELAGSNGLLERARPGVSPCLTYSGWTNENHLSLEHIAPKEKTQGWNENIYENKEKMHCIGNLVLVPSGANSSLGNRPWIEKKIMYAALGAKTKHEAERILSASGITFAQSTEELVALSDYLPHLVALGSVQDDWNNKLIETRSRRILELAWDTLYPWLDD